MQHLWSPLKQQQQNVSLNIGLLYRPILWHMSNYFLAFVRSFGVFCYRYFSPLTKKVSQIVFNFVNSKEKGGNSSVIIIPSHHASLLFYDAKWNCEALSSKNFIYQHYNNITVNLISYMATNWSWNR